jgi:hypothetical protein
MRHRASIGALLLTLVVSLFAIPGLTKASPPPPQAQYFKETGHSAQNWYWQFWKNTPDALRILGFPISEPFVQESFTEPGKRYRVQYFERAVLEEHPENFGRDGNKFYILGRLLGNELIKNRLGEAPFQPVGSIPSNASQTYFNETKHTLRDDATRGPFYTFWKKYGGLAVFGFPTSEPFQERNADTGETYWVQYFERNRLEYQPNQPAEFRVLLGRLGAQYAKDNPDKVSAADFDAREPSKTLPEPFVYGANIRGYYVDRERALTLLKNAFEANNFTGGPAWIRQQVPWRDHMTRDGTIAWGELDPIINDAAAKNVKVLLSIAKSPDWATDNGGDGMPNRANFPKFAQFLRAIVERYRGKVQAIEVWNEQNYAVENGGRVAPAAFYVDLMGAAYDAIKAADPNVIVVSGSPTPTATNKIDVALDDVAYFREMFGIPKFWDKMDVIGAHFAGTLQPPDALPGSGARPEGWNGNSEFFFRRIEDVRAAMEATGHGDRQIWITEMGWATQNNTPGYEYGNYNTMEMQAQYLKRAIERSRYDYAPWVGAVFIWNLNYAVTWGEIGNPLHEQAAFGILNPDWSPRPSYTAIQNMPKP